MQITELFTSLVNQNFRLSVEGDEIVVLGSGTLTSEQQQCLADNKGEIMAILEPDALAEAVGNEFIKYAALDHVKWLWTQIGKQDTVEDLEAFARRFENDLERFEVYRCVADPVRQLIELRRRLLYSINEANDPDAPTSEL